MRTFYVKIQSVQPSIDMVNINLKCLTIICLYFIAVYSESQGPWIWPSTYVDDGNPMIEFTCGAYLKAGEKLIWYREESKSVKQICTQIMQTYDGYRTLKLIWPLAIMPSGSKVYCAKSVPPGKTTWSETRKDVNAIIFRKNKIPVLTDYWGPWLTPDTLLHDDTQFIEFTCWAYLYAKDILSWYQIHDSHKTSRLTMIEQEAEYGYIKIKLRKAVDASDNGTQIYCVRVKKNGALLESKRISLTFTRHIKTLEPYVTVEPSTDIVFFEEDDKLEFVCSGSEPEAGRALTWYLQVPGYYQQIPFFQSYHNKKNHLTLLMEVGHHQSILYCAQDYTFKFLNGSDTNYGEKARSQMITLLHLGRSEPGEHPQVAPEKFVDNHRPFLQFSCYIFLQPREILSWYQSKGSSHADTLLRLVQLQDPRAKEGDWVVLTLNKTLEPGDNGSEVYCARQSVLPDGSFSDVLSASERIPLTFHRDIPPLVNAFITVEPNTTDIFFDVNTTLRLTCSGSKPVDGRNYTWLKKDSESRLTVIEGQKYDQTTNLNVLEMYLSETHHLNLVCALGFLSYIRLNDGSPRLKIYGELTEANTITLIRREKSSEVKQMTSHTIPAEKQTTSHTIPATRVFTAETYGILAVAILLAVTALVTSAVTCCVLRKSWTKPPAPPALTATVDDYGQYANVPREMQSPQVTYAVLDLPRPARRSARAPVPETALYAEVCKR